MTNQHRQIGFTLIELVTVMIIIGILAVAILPRFGDVNTFDARGRLDQTTSLLRFAQKTAIARHQMVYVSLATSPPTFCSYAYTGTPVCVSTSCTSTLPLPGGTYRSPTTTVTLSGTTQFCFDALGRPYASTGAAFSALQTISVLDKNSTSIGTISVEQETGYAH